jgi:hypothetical protein
VNYTFEQVPDDADTQVRIAVQKVIGFVLEDASSPIIQRNAARAAQSGDPIQGVWDQVKPHVRFRQDIDIARDLRTDDPRKLNIVETFIRPVDQAQLIESRGKGVEDCDGFVGYTLCLLTALGIPCAMATVAAEPDSRDYSHTFVVAYWQGKRIPMDTSHGPHVGWECPHHRIREWPVNRLTLMNTMLWPALIVIGLAWFALRGVL